MQGCTSHFIYAAFSAIVVHMVQLWSRLWCSSSSFPPVAVCMGDFGITIRQLSPTPQKHRRREGMAFVAQAHLQTLGESKLLWFAFLLFPVFCHLLVCIMFEWHWKGKSRLAKLPVNKPLMCNLTSCTRNRSCSKTHFPKSYYTWVLGSDQSEGVFTLVICIPAVIIVDACC